MGKAKRIIDSDDSIDDMYGRGDEDNTSSAVKHSGKRMVEPKSSASSVALSRPDGDRVPHSAIRYAGFVEGSIKCIRLQDFMTYKSITFYPGGHLNVIIGPNGTGKSSLMCGICLGLGGKPAVLGRADTLLDFIRHGSKAAVVQITLAGKDEKTYTLERRLTVLASSSNKKVKDEWFINGSSSSLKAVMQLMATLGIQIDNLCQFIPQEKVTDFAKMDGIKLLSNTLKSVDPELLEQLESMKNLRRDELKTQKYVTEMKESLEREQKRNAVLEVDKRNFEERESLLRSAAEMEKKLHWLRYSTYNSDLKSKSLKLMELDTKLDGYTFELKPLKTEEKDLSTKIDGFKAQERTVQEKMNGLDNCCSYATKIEAVGDEIDARYQQLRNHESEEQERLKKLEELKILIGNHVKDLESQLLDTAAIDLQLLQLNEKFSSLNKDLNHINEEQGFIQSEKAKTGRRLKSIIQELNYLDSMRDRRLSMLQNMNKAAYQATLWLHDNHGKFKQQVFDPMMIEVSSFYPSDAKYVESSMSFNEKTSFLFEDGADLERFQKIMDKELGLKVSSVLAPAKHLTFDPPRPIGMLRKYGFRSYLRELIDAPEPILQYLCQMSNVHSVPIGDESTRDHIDHIKASFPDLNKFYTGDVTYSIRYSKYTGNASTSCTKVKPAEILKVVVDKEKQMQLLESKKQIGDEIKKLDEDQKQQEAQVHKLEEDRNAIKSEKKKLVVKRDHIKQLREKIENKKMRISKLEADKPNLEVLRKNVTKDIMKLNIKKISLLEEYTAIVASSKKHLLKYIKICLSKSVLRCKLEGVRQQIKERSDKFNSLEEEVQRGRTEVKNLKAKFTAAAEKMKEALKDELTADLKLSPSLQKKFSEYCDDLDILEAKIHESLARADMVYTRDDNVLAVYLAREENIKKLEVELREKDDQVKELKEKMNQMKGEWSGKVERIIEQICGQFSQYFSKMGCSGEVVLDIPQDPSDFAFYGVKIRVKFRENEPLQDLSPHHQSGGERSVCTMLFMLSLQELNKSPFRCVDEINQGMDPHNERRVFQLLVDSAAKSNMSQYFILTPKLLPKLQYNKYCHCHVIHNGPDMITGDEFCFAVD